MKIKFTLKTPSLITNFCFGTSVSNFRVDFGLSSSLDSNSFNPRPSAATTEINY